MASSLIDRVLLCQQTSAEWFSARCGQVTASKASLCKERLKNGQRSAKAKTYLAQLVAERLTGKAEEHMVTYWMDRGKEFEGEAREAYGLKNDCLVAQVGYVRHPTIPNFGCSPDGLLFDITDPMELQISPNGLEIKCCQDYHHLQYMGVLEGAELIDGVPAEFMDQIDAGLACTGGEWWDFVSYHPDMPEDLRLHVVRVVRNEKRIAELEYAVIEFNAEIEAVLEKL